MDNKNIIIIDLKIMKATINKIETNLHSSDVFFFDSGKKVFQYSNSK
jgi:hypothetical protein